MGETPESRSEDLKEVASEPDMAVEKKERPHIPSVHSVMNEIVNRAIPKPQGGNGMTKRVETQHQRDAVRLILKLQAAVGDRNTSAPPTLANIEGMQRVLRGDGSILKQFPFTSYPEANLQATHAYLEDLKRKPGLEPGFREPGLDERVSAAYASMKTGVQATVAATGTWARDRIGALVAMLPKGKRPPSAEVAEAEAE